MKIVALVLFFLSFFTAPVAYAQVSATPFLNQLQIVTDPLYPSPQSEIGVNLNDYGLAGAGGTIEWVVDGVRRSDLHNKRSFTITTGATGVPMVLEAMITPANGPRMTARNTISPTYLDLIIEAQTRVPGFYLGRALPSIGSAVNVTALINGTAVSPRDLLFRWQMNETALLGGPVQGQNQVTFTMPQGGATLGVVVERVGGGVIASKNIFLQNAEQTVRFYEVNSLYGMAKRSAERLSLIGNSTTVRAEPFHLDIRTYNNPDIATWSSSAITLSQGTNPYEATIVRQAGLTGVGAVGFHVRNENQILQGSQASLQVSY
ncbi:hypothetical protein K2Q16_01015 [Patescibacteria group bacterium]|nr:hypothetical protein [Patescibacteria group bacterium]